jgi:hypothetical protein
MKRIRERLQDILDAITQIERHSKEGCARLLMRMN